MGRGAVLLPWTPDLSCSTAFPHMAKLCPGRCSWQKSLARKLQAGGAGESLFSTPIECSQATVSGITDIMGVMELDACDKIRFALSSS